ncbi:MAG: hypothetical protein P1V19_14880 [Gimesia sp.]|nr:hypothetical protein [Gimesia sp.]
MNHRRQRKLSFRTKTILLLVGVVLPIVLSVVVYDPRMNMLPLFLAPAVLIGVWRDLGFMLGFFIFWGTMIVLGQESIARGQVDNIIPALTIVLGWIPYLIIFGPVFLVFKATERFKAKWAGVHSAVPQELKE